MKLKKQEKSFGIFLYNHIVEKSIICLKKLHIDKYTQLCDNILNLKQFKKRGKIRKFNLCTVNFKKIGSNISTI